MLNGVIALVSLAMALFYGPMEIVECVVGFDITPVSVAVTVDPVFLVWTDSISAAGMSMGSTIVMSEKWRGDPLVYEHEMNHIRQWQALGWMSIPARVFGIVPIEPYGTERYPTVNSVWADMDGANAYMWQPEDGSPQRYHFLSIGIKLGGM